ncbi:hypothetical protein P691DRAFT_781273 [Macrolepiota fuliginosa MF-IS2]|uniref:Uncharacterized protein n=1 Tax=Macrolepiota fuliginosa MF-IS2 TaxID=1400762 RepID=A0A9P6BWK6_9AGAR|nr:hypothetical protein P691DRAFT_781273 [Macrolepiota fuliginosa MF-IS2]
MVENFENLPGAVYDDIRHFDFRFFVSHPQAHSYPCHIVLQWLFLQRAHLPDLVRTDAKSTSDQQLIDKCRGVARPLELHGRRYSFSQRAPVHPPRYALLGHGAQTVLIILCGDGDDMFGEFTFYSLEMLGDI